MKRASNLIMRLVVVLGLVLFLAGPSMATQITNAALSIPFSVGTGNSNAHFAVDKVGDVEVGLKAKLRYLGDVIPIGSTYFVPKGYQPAPDTTYANWNFDWSVKLGDSYIDSYVVWLSYDVDPTANISYRDLISAPAEIGTAQDSWNYGMSFLGIPGFNANLDATYDIMLSVFRLDSSIPLVNSHIQVVVGTPVPEPATMLLLGLGLVGLAGVRRMMR